MAHDEKTLKRMRALGVRPEDLEEAFTRSSGPGGQHVNKVSTQVEVFHRPSGIRIVCSDSRSQSTNRQLALIRLLDEIERQKAEKRQSRLADLSKARRQKAKRSYGTKQEMLRDKRHRSETKQLRHRVSS